jgi:hypothetical protein
MLLQWGARLYDNACSPLVSEIFMRLLGSAVDTEKLYFNQSNISPSCLHIIL